jgi:hypothetical protein
MPITRRDLVSSALTAFAAPAQQTASSDIYAQLVKANDEAIPAVIAALNAARPRGAIRRAGTDLEALAAAFYAPESGFHKAELLIPPLAQAAAILLKAQHPDGTIDAGNLNSPPDTGFVVETVCTALAVLRRIDDPRLVKTRDDLSKFIVAAAAAMTTGGIHTPNHRWVVCSALARANSLFPSSQYVDRIDDWLGEGVYIDADGQFEERSTGIYSRVTDAALVTMARLLNRPKLLDPVRRNLDMNVYYMHPDGEIETVGSRRQDQSMTGSIAAYYLEYRYLAIQDGAAMYADVVRLIEEKQAERVRNGNLIHFIEEPLLRKPLPAGGGIPSDYAKVFANTRLARIRRGEVSATIYGGSDWPLGVESGLASNPTFFNFRKGKAILESVRMGAAFFSLGAFRSAGLAANGNEYALRQRYEAPYYLPLPKELRNADGDYALTPARDHRFWSKLDFPRRPVSNVQTLDQKVTVTENRGSFELRFEVDGHDGVPVTIELAFRPGGAFEGRIEERQRASYLRQGMGKYRAGNDAIEFGPGQAEHEFLNLSILRRLAAARTDGSGLCP